MGVLKVAEKIDVQGTKIAVLSKDDEDFISMTDMVRDIENGLALIEKWLRNKNTIEFLGIWEEIYNPDFNSPEFEGIKNEAGLNRFVLSVKQWVEKTNSRGSIQRRTGFKKGAYGEVDMIIQGKVVIKRVATEICSDNPITGKWNYFTRSMYSPVRVSMRIFWPILQ